MPLYRECLSAYTACNLHLLSCRAPLERPMAEAQHAEASKQPPTERAPERAGEDPGSLARRAVAPSFQGQRLDPRGLSPQAILA